MSEHGLRLFFISSLVPRGVFCTRSRVSTYATRHLLVTDNCDFVELGSALERTNSWSRFLSSWLTTRTESSKRTRSRIQVRVVVGLWHLSCIPILDFLLSYTYSIDIVGIYRYLELG
jgi:hypothetical protein